MELSVITVVWRHSFTRQDASCSNGSIRLGGPKVELQLARLQRSVEAVFDTCSEDYWKVPRVSSWNSLYNACQCVSEQIRRARCGNTARRDLGGGGWVTDRSTLILCESSGSQSKFKYTWRSGVGLRLLKPIRPCEVSRILWLPLLSQISVIWDVSQRSNNWWPIWGWFHRSIAVVKACAVAWLPKPVTGAICYGIAKLPIIDRGSSTTKQVLR